MQLHPFVFFWFMGWVFTAGMLVLCSETFLDYMANIVVGLLFWPLIFGEILFYP